MPGRWDVDNNNEHRSRVVTLSATRARVRLGDPATPNLDFAGLSPAAFHRFPLATARPPVDSRRSSPRAPRRTGTTRTILALALALPLLATIGYFAATRPTNPSPASLPVGNHVQLDVCHSLLSRTRHYPEPLERLCAAPR